MQIAVKTEKVSRETTARGPALLNAPALNKGMAFTAGERKEFGLEGLLPSGISTLALQVDRAYKQYGLLTDSLSKNIYLAALQDRNEVLFYRMFSEHLREMIPIVNDLTVGTAIEHYNHECRPARGLYLSIDQPEAIEQSLSNLGHSSGDIDLVLATDAEQILGAGDCGIGGIEVSIGKLAIYTAAGGIDPARVIPVMLDVGTNRRSLLEDRLYVGNRHPRVTGESYDAFIDAYVKAVTRRFPYVLMQWEDFAPGNGRRILERYRDRICTFNDDIQGTGAITLAALFSALRACGTPIRNQRVVIFGAGTAGIGIADQIRAAMIRDGLPAARAENRFWCVDREGLLSADRAGSLPDYQKSYARPASEKGNGLTLAEVVRRVQPTVLIGASNAPATFTETIVRDMAAHTERPVIFALSIPQALAEANPADLIAWTNGRALIATGSPFAPVTYQGVTYVVAHLSNALLYPGLALGTLVARARCISAGMLAAAASAVSSLVTVRQPGVSLLPQIDNLRSVSVTVAAAVAEAAEIEGLARAPLPDIVQQVRDAMWQPEYRGIRGV